MLLTFQQKNAQGSHVCVVHQDDTDLSTGSGLEWLWIERDDLWIKLTSINFCIIQDPLRWICQKDDTLSLLESGHQSSILLMISQCVKQPQWRVGGEHNWQFLQCLGWWFTAWPLYYQYEWHFQTSSIYYEPARPQGLTCNAWRSRAPLQEWTYEAQSLTCGHIWWGLVDEAGGNDRCVWKALATLPPL